MESGARLDLYNFCSAISGAAVGTMASQPKNGLRHEEAGLTKGRVDEGRRIVFGLPAT